MVPPIDLERIAKAIHREWARSTVRHLVKKHPETEDEAHERRWALLPPVTRAEFMRLAEAAWHAIR